MNTDKVGHDSANMVPGPIPSINTLTKTIDVWLIPFPNPKAVQWYSLPYHVSVLPKATRK